MTHNHLSSPLLKTLGIALLAVLLLTGTATAGSLFIDTTGIVGNVDETTKVPVKVTGANSLYSFTIQFKTGETADYTIAFHEDNEMKKYVYNQESGKVTQINLAINGDTTLFYLDVTPKTAKAVDLEIISSKLREGTVDSVTLVPYTITGATLNVGTASTPTETPSETPTSTPTTTPSETPTATPSPTQTSSGTPSQPGSSTVIPGTSTPSEIVPTFTPTTTPTDDKPTTGGSYLPYIIAVLGILAILILIIVIVKRRS